MTKKTETQTTNESTLTLPSDTEILLERSFAAPRERVWRAFTDPKLVPRWIGLPGFPMTVCEMDVRPQGRFRWSFAGEGIEFTTAGVFHAVERPHLLVMESMDPDPMPEVRTTTFQEAGGRTTVLMRIQMASKGLRDEMLASGTIEGMKETFVRLDQLLTTIA